MQIPITMAAAVLFAVLVAAIVITCGLIRRVTYACNRREDYTRSRLANAEQDVLDLTATLDDVNTRYRDQVRQTDYWKQQADYHQKQVAAVVAELEEMQAECAADTYDSDVSNLETPCKRCGGSGMLDDAEPGDTSYNEWPCPDCKGGDS